MNQRKILILTQESIFTLPKRMRVQFLEPAQRVTLIIQELKSKISLKWGGHLDWKQIWRRYL